LCAGGSASQLEHFVSLLAHPAGRECPLRFALALHHLEHLRVSSQPYCEAELRIGLGDARFNPCLPTGPWSSDDVDGSTRFRRRVHDGLDKLVARLLNL